MMSFLLLIIGFIFLIKGADILVDGAASIGKKMGISSLVIGLTIVAFGTSSPELVVNIISALSQKTDLAISNILGSNISNIFLILGVTAMVYPIGMPQSTVKKEIPFVIFVGVLLLILLYDGFLSRSDALILCMFFVLFLYYTFTIAKVPKHTVEQEKEVRESESIKNLSNLHSICFVLGGLGGLVLGGKMIVNSAITIAQSFGLPMSFIGVTIIALGTSLPELASSLVAAFKKQTDMAIGGIVGSNIFNILWILGVTGFIYPLEGYRNIQLDLLISLFASILIFIAAFVAKKNFLTRWEGLILFLFYLGYISYLIGGVI